MQACIHPSLEESSILNQDARSGDIANQRSIGTHRGAVGSMQIPAHLASYDNFTGGHTGGHLTVTAQRNAVATQMNAPFEHTVHQQRARASDLTFQDQSFADKRLVIGHSASADIGLAQQ